MKCIVTTIHFKPCVRKGDTESEFAIEKVKHFKTKKKAVAYAKSCAERMHKAPIKIQHYKDSVGVERFIAETGYTWRHENTGDDCTECYIYKIEKV